MTEERIDAMPPGCELDATVAESFALPAGQYSAEIAAAWRVVSEMERNGFRLMLDKRGSQGGLFVAKWHAAFSEELSGGYFTANGVSAAHAICLASLKCVQKGGGDSRHIA